MFSQFGRSVMSNSLRPRGLQHARLPCPSPSPRCSETDKSWECSTNEIPTSPTFTHKPQLWAPFLNCQQCPVVGSGSRMPVCFIQLVKPQPEGSSCLEDPELTLEAVSVSLGKNTEND